MKIYKNLQRFGVIHDGKLVNLSSGCLHTFLAEGLKNNRKLRRCCILVTAKYFPYNDCIPSCRAVLSKTDVKSYRALETG